MHDTNMTLPRSLRTTACAVALVLMSAAGFSQTDDDGVLPGKSTGGSAAGGGGGATQGLSGVVVDLTMNGPESPIPLDALDGAMPSVTFSVASGLVEVVDGNSTDVAPMLHANGFEPFRYTGDGEVAVQGHGLVTLPDGVELTMTAAPDAIARTAVLLFHEYDIGTYGAPIVTDALGAVLDGSAPASGAILLGDVDEMDLDKFQRVVAKHAQDMPGVVVTLAFLAVDENGVPHASGARASTAGDLLEFATW